MVVPEHQDLDLDRFERARFLDSNRQGQRKGLGAMGSAPHNLLTATPTTRTLRDPNAAWRAAIIPCGEPELKGKYGPRGLEPVGPRQTRVCEVRRALHDRTLRGDHQLKTCIEYEFRERQGENIDGNGTDGRIHLLDSAKIKCVEEREVSSMHSLGIPAR